MGRRIMGRLIWMYTPCKVEQKHPSSVTITEHSLPKTPSGRATKTAIDSTLVTFVCVEVLGSLQTEKRKAIRSLLLNVMISMPDRIHHTQP